MNPQCDTPARTRSQHSGSTCGIDDQALTVEDLTIRRALDEVGLRAPARFYPEWACAEVFVLVLLRIGVRLPATTVLRRGNEVGLPEQALRRAKMRLGVTSIRQRGVRHGVWLWQLPPDLAAGTDLERIDRPWRRWRNAI